MGKKCQSPPAVLYGFCKTAAPGQNSLFAPPGAGRGALLHPPKIGASVLQFVEGYQKKMKPNIQ